MKINSNGFSLVEMEISLVIATIIVVAIGTIACISDAWYSHTKQESDLLSDVSYTFRLLKSNIRSAPEPAGSIAIISAPNTHWVSGYSVLQFGNVGYFGLYNNTTTNSHDLVYSTNVNVTSSVNPPNPVTTLKIYPSSND